MQWRGREEAGLPHTPQSASKNTTPGSQACPGSIPHHGPSWRDAENRPPSPLPLRARWRHSQRTLNTAWAHFPNGSAQAEVPAQRPRPLTGTICLHKASSSLALGPGGCRHPPPRTHTRTHPSEILEVRSSQQSKLKHETPSLWVWNNLREPREVAAECSQGGE